MSSTPSKSSFQRRREILRAKARRRLRVETLEERRLLAVVAADGFESGNFAGGSEQWDTGSWVASGDATVRSDTSPASGSKHARLRRSTGDLQRTVDVTGLTDVRLQFSAKLISFEGSDRADVKVSGDGTNWTTLQSFVNGDDDGQYHDYDLAVPDQGNTLHVRFDAGMSGSGDYWFLDNVQVTGTQAGPPTVSISDAEATEGGAAWGFADAIALDSVGTQVSSWALAKGQGDQLYATYSPVNGNPTGASGIALINSLTGDVERNFVPVGTSGLENARELEVHAGWIYVGNKGTNEILRFDEATGAADPNGPFVAANAGGLTTPRGIVFDADGNLLISSKDTDAILKFNGVDGSFLSTFAAAVTGGGTGPKDLAYDAANGLLYVAGNNQLYRYNAVDGTLLGTIAATELTDPAGVELGSDGHLYTTNASTDQVLLFDLQSDSLLTTIDIDPVYGEAVGIAFDSAGSLYLGTHLTQGEVVRFAPSSSAVFRVTLSLPSALPITLDFATGDASATAGSDYALTAGTLTFEPGVTSRTIIVPTIDDADVEGDETFSVNLSNATGATLADGNGMGTIVDDDASREITISDAAATEGANALREIDYFVSEAMGGLSNPRSLVLGPDSTGDGEQELYVISGNTNEILRFDGSTGAYVDAFVTGVTALISPKDLRFSPVDGNLYVSSDATNEVLRFDGTTGAYIDTPVGGLANPMGLSFAADGSLLIANQNTDEVLRYDGTTLSAFVSSGSGGLDRPRVAVLGPDGNADGSQDLYVASHNTNQVLRYDGLTGAFIDVFSTVTGVGGPNWIQFGTDGILYATARNATENLDRSLFRIDAATGAILDTTNLGREGWQFVLGPDNTIYNSSSGIGNFIARIGPESWGAFTISLSTASNVPVTVEYATSDDSATAGSDYTATSGTVVFSPGETTRTIIVKTIDDAVAESIETFNVTLSNPIGGVIANPTPAVGVIFDDDATNQAPLVDAGEDQTLTDTDDNGSEEVTLSGLAFDLDGTIISAEWTLNGNVLGTTPIVNTTLPVGVHMITLTATDDDGASGSDTLVVTVNPAPTEVVLFEDSFEVGSNSNDWNGKWTEDSQNDFFRSTQRSTDGARSAEVDGFASNATLTLATPMDLTGHVSNTLTFDWLIENGFDNGEFLSLDISTDAGNSWTYDVRRLDGNVDAENTWHSEAVDLSGYSTSNLLIRFRSYVSSSKEDANIDNVKIAGFASAGSGSLLAAPPKGSGGGTIDEPSLASGESLGSLPTMDPLDVNQDGYTTPMDALMVVNWLNQSSTDAAPAQLDTNQDGLITPIDMLLIVNELNDPTQAEGEAALPVPPMDADAIDRWFGEIEDEEESLLGSDLASTLE